MTLFYWIRCRSAVKSHVHLTALAWTCLPHSLLGSLCTYRVMASLLGRRVYKAALRTHAAMALAVVHARHVRVEHFVLVVIARGQRQVLWGA